MFVCVCLCVCRCGCVLATCRVLRSRVAPPDAVQPGSQHKHTIPTHPPVSLPPTHPLSPSDNGERKPAYLSWSRFPLPLTSLRCCRYSFAALRVLWTLKFSEMHNLVSKFSFKKKTANPPGPSLRRFARHRYPPAYLGLAAGVDENKRKPVQHKKCWYTVVYNDVLK